MEHLNNANSASNFRQCAIEPHCTSDVHLLIQRHTSSGVDKLEHGVQVVRLPGHLLMRMLEVDAGSTHGEGDLGILIGEREGSGGWRGDDAENLWHVCDLDPENVALGRDIRLEQELHRADLYELCSVYTPGNTIPKCESKRTFAGRIPGLVPSEGRDRIRGTFRKERRAANVGREHISHDLVAPCMLQTRDTHHGDVEAPRKHHVPVRMTTRHLDSTEEAI